MLVSIRQDNIGGLIISPVNERLQRRYARHLRKFDKHADGTIYIQSDFEVESFLQEYAPRHKRDIEHGWTARIRMDQWCFATMLGYDANTI